MGERGRGLNGIKFCLVVKVNLIHFLDFSENIFLYTFFLKFVNITKENFNYFMIVCFS